MIRHRSLKEAAGRDLPMVPTVPAATFSPELADLTITAPSIESWREAQHAPLRAARRHLI